MVCQKRIAFVDLQGFVVNKHFVLKELCISITPPRTDDLRGAPKHHYIFGPPFPYKFVNSACKRGIIWLTTFKHGFYWNDGVMPYNRIDRAIDPLRSSDLIIYVKGVEKLVWLKEICAEENIDCRNIEEIGCNFRLIDRASKNLNCGHHRHMNKNCALQSVTLIENWFYNAAENMRQKKAGSERTFSQCPEEFYSP